MDKRELSAHALDALENAYAPYSGYRVGAALLCRDGTVVTGCNVENASYGLSLCAERNAVAAAIGQGHGDILAVAIAADGEAEPVPCGACRQVLSEFCGPETAIYTLRKQKPETINCHTLGELLPHGFDFKAKS